MNELKYFYTTIKDGPMNTNRLYYNDKMTSSEIKARKEKNIREV